MSEPLISADTRPRCQTTKTVSPKFGEPYIVECNKFLGHTDPDNRRFTRRHWNVAKRIGWFTKNDS